MTAEKVHPEGRISVGGGPTLKTPVPGDSQELVLGEPSAGDAKRDLSGKTGDSHSAYESDAAAQMIFPDGGAYSDVSDFVADGLDGASATRITHGRVLRSASRRKNSGVLDKRGDAGVSVCSGTPKWIGNCR
jgi:hypothetical protein